MKVGCYDQAGGCVMHCNHCNEVFETCSLEACARAERRARGAAVHAQAVRWLRLRRFALLPTDRTGRDAGRKLSFGCSSWDIGGVELWCARRRWHCGEDPIDRRTARALLHAAEVYASEEE